MNQNDENIRSYLKNKQILAKNEMQKVKEQIDLTRCKELIEGERPTKCFFQKFKPNSLKAKYTFAIKDDSGQEQTKLEKNVVHSLRLFWKTF